MRRRHTSFHAALPLAITAVILLVCSATMSTLTGQTTGSGSTATGSSAASLIINAPASRSSVQFRLPSPSSRQSTIASSVASSGATSTPPPGIDTSTIVSASLSDDEREFRDMLERVLQAKEALRLERTGPTFTLDQEPSDDLVITEEPDPAGCFSDDGIWTIDAASCASDQAAAFVRLRKRPAFEREPIAMGMPSSVIRVAMVSLVVPIEPAEETRMTPVAQSWYPQAAQSANDVYQQTIAVLRAKAFATTLELAIHEMQYLVTDVRRVPSVAQRIQASMQWAKQLLSALQSGSTPTLDSLEEYKGNLRDQIADVQAALEDLPSLPPNFTAMQQLIGRIVDRAPLVFSRMGTADIPLQNEAAEAYLEAKDAYDVIRDCDPADICPELALALDALSRMARELDYAISDSGQLWMYDEVDLIFTAE